MLMLNVQDKVLERICAAYTLVYMHKGKAIPVTGRGDPYGFGKSRLPYFLDNRLTDGGEVVSLKRRPPFTPKIPGTHFC
jgi:hypothetical protein